MVDTLSDYSGHNKRHFHSVRQISRINYTTCTFKQNLSFNDRFICKMKELEELIRSIGEVKDSFYNPFKEGITLPLEKKSLEIAQNSVNNIFETLQNKKFREMPDKFAEHMLDFEKIESEDRQLSIAGRMFCHDLRNIWGIISNYSLPIVVAHLTEEKKKSPEFLKLLINNLEHIQLISSSMAYLGSHGDKKYLEEFSVDQLEHLLRGIYHQEIRVDNSNIPKEARIRNDWYACISQLVKNALSHGRDGVIPRLDIINTFRKSPSGQTYHEIRVEDTASGLAYEDQPLDKKTVGQIFKKFSTTGGGLGGQIISTYIDLANEKLGNEKFEKCKYDIDLISKVCGKPFLYYNLMDNLSAFGFPAIDSLKFKECHIPINVPNIRHGSSFRLLLPKDENSGELL